MMSPRISLAVVIKGPVARAGSILTLFSINGIKVPLRLAKMITLNKAMEAVKLSINSK